MNYSWMEEEHKQIKQTLGRFLFFIFVHNKFDDQFLHLGATYKGILNE